MATKAKVAAAAAVVLITGAIGWIVLSIPEPAASEVGPMTQPQSPMRSVAAGPAAPNAVPIIPKRFEETPPSAPASRAGTVTGLVVDDQSGEPVAGAAVSAFVDLGDELPESSATTSVDGRFQIESSRRPGVVLPRLLVTSPRHVRWCGDNRVYPFGKDQVSGNDVGTIRLTRGAAVSGRVLSAATRQPVAGVQLFLHGYRGGFESPIFRNADPAGTSGADGTFTTTTRLPPSRGAPVQILALHDGGLDWANVAVLKETEEVRDVEILARPGYSLRVRVTDESGKALDGATVMVAPRFAPLGMSFPAVDWMSDPKHTSKEGPLGLLTARLLHKSDPEGETSFDGLPEPVLDPSERFPSSRTDVFAFKQGFDPGRVRLEKISPGKLVEIVLKVHRPFVVMGVVRGPDRAPIPGADVALVSKHVPLGSARTNETGEYRITTDTGPDAAATLSAEAVGFSRAVESVALESGKDVQQDFTMLPALSINARVLDESGAPVAGMVQVSDRMRSGRALSGKRGGVFNAGVIQPDGTVEFEGADSGDWTLTLVLGKEWEPQRERIVHGGDHVEIVVARSVPGTATLDAEIVDAATGKPVDPLSATLTSRSTFGGERFYPPQPTVSPGHVRAENVPPGAWRLYVHTAQFRRRLHDFVVSPSDQDIRLRIELGKSAVIVAHVVLDDVPASLRPPKVGLSAQDQNNEQGGVWVDEAGKPARQSHTGVASTENGWAARCELVPPGVPIRLSVANFKIVDEKIVTLAPGEERTVELRPVASGTARFVTSKPFRAGLVFKDRDAAGAWIEMFRVSEAKEGWSQELRRRPGPFAWRVELWPLDVPPSARVPKIVEGEATIETGKTTPVVITVE